MTKKASQSETEFWDSVIEGCAGKAGVDMPDEGLREALNKENDRLIHALWEKKEKKTFPEFYLNDFEPFKRKLDSWEKVVEDCEDSPRLRIVAMAVGKLAAGIRNLEIMLSQIEQAQFRRTGGKK